MVVMFGHGEGCCARPWRRLLCSAAATTGILWYAECQKHSAKTNIHSAKCLPTVALGKGYTAKGATANSSLPSAFSSALGKESAVCYLALGKKN